MDARAQFFALFLELYKSGRGRSAFGLSKGAWTDVELSEALSEGRQTFSDESVRNWRIKKHFPRKPAKDRLADTFFKADLAEVKNTHNSDREKFDSLWQTVKEEEARQENLGHPASLHPNEEWRIQPGQKTDALAELNVHAPTRTNEPETYHLRITLILGLLQQEHEGFPVTIGITAAQLRLSSHSFQLAAQSDINHRYSNGYVRRIAGGFSVIGPTRLDGQLEGVTLDGEPISQIEAIGSTIDPIYISLTATRQDFCVEVSDSSADQIRPSANKCRILDALVYDDLKKDNGRAVLADVILQRIESPVDGT